MSSSGKTPRRRISAEEKEVRKIRIFNWLGAGFSLEEIARMEKISREWARQLLASALKERDNDARIAPGKLDEIRLEAAMRLACRAIIENKLEGVDRLVKVIDRLQKMRGAPKKPIYDSDARARLLAKLNLNVSRLPARPAEPEPEKSLESPASP